MNRIPAIVIVDEIRGRRRRGQENITASASTSDSSRKRRSVMRLILVLLLLLDTVAVAPAAVVTLPFIKRQMVLGLVEGVLQLGDAPPPVGRF